MNPFLIRGKRAVLMVSCMTLLGACAMLPGTPAPAPAPALEPAPVQAPKSAVTEVPVAAIPTAVVPVPVVVPTPVDPKPEVAATTAAVVVPAAPTAPAAAVPPVVAKPEVQPTSVLARGFYINVGLFAVPTNGSNAYKKLEAAGLPVFTDVLKTKKGPLTRVRVGPFADRAQADAAVKKIQTLKLDANVFQH